MSIKNLNRKNKQYLDYLIDSSLQGVNRLFDLSFENEDDRETHRGYFQEPLLDFIGGTVEVI